MMADPREKTSGQGKESAQSPTSSASAGEAASQADQEWIFTVSGSSGELLRIEKLDKATGQRKEVSQEEYAAMIGYDPYYAAAMQYASAYYDPYAAYYAAAYDPSLFEQAYYQGAADYAAALETYAAYGYSPIEQAYYQGIADYEAALYS